jgi:O-antigen/teichoic acid export membrane protein
MKGQSSVRLNIAANIVGKGTSAILGVVFPPIYMRFLGVESYGLIGVFASLSAMVSLLELGLGATLQRQLAVVSGDSRSSRDRPAELVRTFEAVYLGIGVTAATAIALLSSIVAHRWLHVGHLAGATVVTSIQLMGLVIALQWPGGLYSSAVLSLQRQVAANTLLAAASVVKWCGGAIVLWKVSPTIQALLTWHAAVALLQTVAFRVLLNRVLPRAGRGRFRLSILLQSWRLSAGLWLITLLALALTQIDKVVVSKILPLADLGYYTLAGTVSNALYYLCIPVTTAVFPRFCEFVGAADTNGLIRLYHRSTQILAALLMPVTVTVVLFPREVLLAWTGNPTIVAHTSTVAALLTAGTSLNALMNIPYSLQLAYGWTRLTIWINAVAVVVLLPTVYFLASRFGSVGAAAGWLLLNSGYVFIGVQLVHVRFLPNEKGAWYVDILRPLLASLTCATAVRLIFAKAVVGRPEALACVVAAIALSGAGVAWATPVLRDALGSAIAARTRSA